MKLNGWKRQTGAAMAMPMILARLAEQFLGIDTGDVDKWLMVLAMVGGPLWGLGWVDKILPFTKQLEKVLEAFNAWAQKRGNQAGAISVKSMTISAAFAAGITIGGGVGYQVNEEKYDDNATFVEVSDTLLTKRVDKDSKPLPDVVNRGVIAFDTTGAFVVGDSMTVLVLKNKVIVQEIVRKITQAPLPPNDAIAATVRVYMYDDRVAPMPEEIEVAK